MDSSTPRKGLPLVIATTVVFVAGFPVVAHLIPGGELFGACAVVPISLMAWKRGWKSGVVFALFGAIFTQVVFSLEYLVWRGNPASSYWLLTTLVPTLAFFFIGFVVGKLSDTLRQLRQSMEAKEGVESALRESQERFRDVFMNAPFGYFRSTPEGTALAANPTFARMLGYDTPQEGLDAVNAGGIAAMIYEDPALRERIVAEAIRSDQWKRHEVRFRRKDSSLVTTHLIIRSYREPGSQEVVLEGFVEDISERKLAEENAANSHQHLEALLDALPDVMLELDASGRIHDCRAIDPMHITGEPRDLIGRVVGDVMPAEASGPIMDALSEAVSSGRTARATYALPGNGRTSWFELSIAPVGDESSRDRRFIALAREVTDRKILEQQLLQSQKMEAVGRLAGGVAHDFNNILMAILGYCELIQEAPDDTKEVVEDVRIIADSANRAVSLTRQLLAFSRKQLLQPKVLDVIALVQQMEKMLARTLGEDISLNVVPSTQPAIVKADEGQLQQVILNLAVNARDAMPGGGRLLITAENIVVTKDDPARPVEVVPGRYVLLSVTDTGSGMDQETISHLFEPFFTTKELGKGTGLGLSIVYGIIKQSEGYIYARSAPGKGASFHILLPQATGQPATKGTPVLPPLPPGGSETVLLVEDDPHVRTLIHRSLQKHGYTVLEAANGEEALRVCGEHAGGIDLLISDVVMPGIGGRVVAREVRKSSPAAVVILMSGHAERGNLELSESEPFLLLHKPVRMRDLLAKVREMLALRSSTG